MFKLFHSKKASPSKAAGPEDEIRSLRNEIKTLERQRNFLLAVALMSSLGTLKASRTTRIALGLSHTAADSAQIARESANRASESVTRAEMITNAAVRTELIYKNTTQDQNAMRTQLRWIFNQPPDQIQYTPDVPFRIFDWMKSNIQYSQGWHHDRRNPEIVLRERIGDCDEQAGLFVGMIEEISKNRTRVISLAETPTTQAHAYGQVLISPVGEAVDTLARPYIGQIARYSESDRDRISADDLFAYGLDIDSARVWLSFDTTAKTPGYRLCRTSYHTCTPLEVRYPDYNQPYRQVDAGVRN